MTSLFVHRPLYRRTPTWRRVGINWHLVVMAQTVARLIHTPEGWLSVGLLEPSNGWCAVDFHTLAQGKAALSRWWARRNSYCAFEQHMRTDLHE
jgi:hypothetical protein